MLREDTIPISDVNHLPMLEAICFPKVVLSIYLWERQYELHK